MKIDKKLLEDHQIQLNVSIDEDTFTRSKRRAARRISKNNKIPGFRPGKAPYHVVTRQFGEGAVIEEALEFLVDDLYPRLLEEEEITPYGPGQLKEVKSLEPPQLEFVIPLAPNVELGDYHVIRRDHQIPEVTDEDVENAIEDLLEREAKTEIVDRPAREGDRVYITLHAFEKGEEDGDLLVDLHRTPVVVESEEAVTDQEWPFPGFSNALAGLDKGAEKEFSNIYPDDYERDEKLRGKSVEFRVVVEEVRSRELPELNDEFARSAGEYDSVDELRAEARRQLEAAAKERYEEEYRNIVLDEIVAGAAFKYPPQMVEEEMDEMLSRFKQRLSNEGWELDTYLKVNDKEEESLREEFREAAEKRVRRGLAVMEIAAQESIQVHEKDVQQDVQRTVDYVTNTFEPRERRKILNQDFLRGLVSGAMRDTLTERTLDRVVQIARGDNEADEAAGDEKPAAEASEQPAGAADAGDAAAESSATAAEPPAEKLEQPEKPTMEE